MPLFGLCCERRYINFYIQCDVELQFQALLRHPSIKINAQTNDGSTALMSAVRLDISCLVSELLEVGSNVDLTDNSGEMMITLLASHCRWVSSLKKCFRTHYFSLAFRHLNIIISDVSSSSSCE